MVVSDLYKVSRGTDRIARNTSSGLKATRPVIVYTLLQRPGYVLQVISRKAKAGVLDILPELEFLKNSSKHQAVGN